MSECASTKQQGKPFNPIAKRYGVLYKSVLLVIADFDFIYQLSLEMFENDEQRCIVQENCAASTK